MSRFHFVIKMLLVFIASNFFFESDMLCADDTNKSGEYKFYGIGIEDNLKSTFDKLNKHNHTCIKGKAISLETSDIKSDDFSEPPPKEISQILLFDEELRTWGVGLKISDMPIDVIHCMPEDGSPFKNWNYYFSTLTGKILGISIAIEDFDPVKDILKSKFGNCMLNNFCKKEMNFMLLYQKAENRYLRIFYRENIILHHRNTKSAAEQRKKKKKENLNGAF